MLLTDRTNGGYNDTMTQFEKLLAKMRESPKSIRFSQLELVCEHYFGKPRSKGTSHHFYKTPWRGAPYVNLQPTANGQAKPYQVRQVLQAIDRLEQEQQ